MDTSVLVSSTVHLEAWNSLEILLFAGSPLGNPHLISSLLAQKLSGHTGDPWPGAGGSTWEWMASKALRTLVMGSELLSYTISPLFPGLCHSPENTLPPPLIRATSRVLRTHCSPRLPLKFPLGSSDLPLHQTSVPLSAVFGTSASE